MAINTYKQFLMKGTTSSGTTTVTYTKLLDIKETPDIGSSREALETTTKSDRAQTFIPGIIQISSDGLSFTCNYDKTDYTNVIALKDTETPYAIWFGGTDNANGVPTPTGSEGKWEFKGYADAVVVGSGVNEVQNMNVVIIPSTPITPA